MKKLLRKVYAKQLNSLKSKDYEIEASIRRASDAAPARVGAGHK